MNVLLSVFECNPLRGSDSYVGWSYTIHMAKHHCVYALTRAENRADIESYCKKHNITDENLHFIYVEQSPLFTKILYKLNHQLGFLGSYFVWQHTAYNAAKGIIRGGISIDVCHHVSIADFRCAGYLWKLDIPFVFGPVGGGQETPDCLKCYTQDHKKSEIFRTFLNCITTLMPEYKKALKKARVIYSSNDETTQYIKKRLKNVDTGKIVQLTELCIDSRYLEERECLKKENGAVVHIIVSGRLIYRKGISLLLDAVSKMKTERSYCIDIFGDGDEKKCLERKNKNLYSQGQETVVKYGYGRKKTEVVPERLDRRTVGRDSATVYGDAKLHVEQAGIDGCSTVFGGFRV